MTTRPPARPWTIHLKAPGVVPSPLTPRPPAPRSTIRDSVGYQKLTLMIRLDRVSLWSPTESRPQPLRNAKETHPCRIRGVNDPLWVAFNGQAQASPGPGRGKRARSSCPPSAAHPASPVPARRSSAARSRRRPTCQSARAAAAVKGATRPTPSGVDGRRGTGFAGWEVGGG